MNAHEIASAWSVHRFRARRGEISAAALAAAGRELIASTSIADLKAQRFLETIVKKEVQALEKAQLVFDEFIGCGVAEPKSATPVFSARSVL